MPGFPDYTAQAILNWLTGQTAMPANAARYIGLFTTAPTSDAGTTGATEISTGGGSAYARVQVAGTAATSAGTLTSSAVLTFSATPAWLLATGNGIQAAVGCSVTDLTAPTAIPAATTILSANATTVTMSANAAGPGVGSGDTIVFSAFTPASASSGAEPATLPAAVVNNATIPFAQSGTSWGTVPAAGIFDASTAGNLLSWDYLGAGKWLPFTCTFASPGVLTSTAHGYANGNQVVVTAKGGGALPTTAGSWAGLLTVANSTTNTFTAGVNTTAVGDGLVRLATPIVIPISVQMSFPASTFTFTES